MACWGSAYHTQVPVSPSPLVALMFRRIGLYLTPQTLHLRNPRIAYALARDPISPRSPPSWTPSSPLGGIARGKSSRQPARVARTRGPPETRNAARDGVRRAQLGRTRSAPVLQGPPAGALFLNM